MSKGLIIVPHTGLFYWPFVANLRSIQTPPQTDFDFIMGALIYDAREGAAEHMMKNGYEWLVFLDSDMVVPPDGILRLLSHDVPIVGGLCFKKVPPFEPVIYGKGDGLHPFRTIASWQEKSLMEVEGIGTAFLLVRREVFEKTQRPWFAPEMRYADGAIVGLSEDLSFCKRVREAGFKIYCDTGIICGHVSTSVVTERSWKQQQIIRR